MKQSTHSLILSLFAFLLLTTNGLAAVTPSGTFNYTIPIPLPDGVGKAKPTISLKYSSNYQGGILGHGWKIAGLPIISRMDHKQSIQYSSSDTYVSSHGRLTDISGTRQEYRAKNDPWTIYKPEGECGTGQPCKWIVTDIQGNISVFGGTGDARVEAIFNPDDPRANDPEKQGAVRIWALSAFTDSSGNSYRIRFKAGGGLRNGEYYPEEISWSNFSLRFHYEARKDVRVSYRQGSRVVTDKILKEITLHNGSALLDSYKLYYSESSVLSQLTAVYRNGQRIYQGEWGNNFANNDANEERSITFGGLLADLKPGEFYRSWFTDVDGNGTVDFCYETLTALSFDSKVIIRNPPVAGSLTISNGYYKKSFLCRLVNHSGSAIRADDAFDKANEIALALRSFNFNPKDRNHDYLKHWTQFVDVDRDGFRELCRFVDHKLKSDNSGTEWSVNSVNVHCLQGGPTGFSGGFYLSQGEKPDDFRALINTNNPHGPDYCRKDSNSIRCSKRNSSGQRHENYTIPVAIPGNVTVEEKERYFADVTGKREIDDYCQMDVDATLRCFPHTDSTEPVSEMKEAGSSNWRTFVNVDGDYADFCTIAGPESLVTCFLSTGKAFDGGKFQVPDASKETDFRTFADVNGDGKADYCELALTNEREERPSGDITRIYSHVKCRLNTGAGFAGEVVSSHGLSHAIQTYPNESWQNPQMIDVNHDGKSDFCGVFHGAPRCLISDGKSFSRVVNLFDNNRVDEMKEGIVVNHDKLSAIIDINGGTTHIDYTFAPMDKIETCSGEAETLSGDSCGISDTSKKLVVARVMKSDGRIETGWTQFGRSIDSLTTWKYHNGRVYPGITSIRRELGFEQITKTTEYNGTVLSTKVTRYNQNAHFGTDKRRSPFVGSPTETILYIGEETTGEKAKRIVYSYNTKGEQLYPTNHEELAQPLTLKKEVFEFFSGAPYRKLTDWKRYDAMGRAIKSTECIAKFNGENEQCQTVGTQFKYPVFDSLRHDYTLPVKILTQEGRSETQGNILSGDYFTYNENDKLTKLEKLFCQDANSCVEGKRVIIKQNIQYSTSGQITAEEDAQGNRIDYRYSDHDLPNRITEKTFPIAGLTEKYYYNGRGQRTIIVDFNGNLIRTEYDRLGRPRKSISPLAPVESDPTQSVTTLYYKRGSPALDQNYNLIATREIIDNRTRRTAETKAWEYRDGLGFLYKTERRLENRDAMGRWKPHTILTTSEQHHNGNGERIIKSSFPFEESLGDKGKHITTTFDRFGGKKRTERFAGPASPLNSLIEYTYVIDATGNKVITKTDRRSAQNSNDRDFVTIEKYDLRGRLIEKTTGTGAEQSTISYHYDNRGRLTSIISPPAGNGQSAPKTLIRYDSLGRKTNMIDPELGTISYEYDSVGNPTRTIRHGRTGSEQDRVTRFEYDAMGRQIKRFSNFDPITGSIGAERLLTEWFYDESNGGNNLVGRLSSLKNYHYKQANSSPIVDEYRYSYDKAGNPEKQDWLLAGLEKPMSEQFEYNGFGRILRYTFPDRSSQRQTLLRGGLTDKILVRETELDKEQQYVRFYDFDSNEKFQKKELKNGVVTTYNYNEIGGLQTLRSVCSLQIDGTTCQQENHGKVLQNLTYQFDSSGYIRAIVNQRSDADTTASGVNTSETQRFAYDTKGRLTTAWWGPESEETERIEYTFGPGGNLESILRKDPRKETTSSTSTSTGSVHEVPDFGYEKPVEEIRPGIPIGPGNEDILNGPGSVFSAHTGSAIAAFGFQPDSALPSSMSQLSGRSSGAAFQYSKALPQSRMSSFAFEYAGTSQQNNSSNAAFEYVGNQPATGQYDVTFPIEGETQKEITGNNPFQPVPVDNTQPVDNSILSRLKFEYNGQRVVSATNRHGVEVFTAKYDRYGNMVQRWRADDPKAESEIPIDQRVPWNYHYDGEDRLIRVNKGDKLLLELRYTPTGERVQKIYHGPDYRITTWYIGSSYELRVFQKGSETRYDTTRYIHAEGHGKIASITRRHTAAEFLNGPVLSQMSVSLIGNTHDYDGLPEGVHFYHSNHIGSSSVITDEAGNQITRINYDPYGAVAQSRSDGTNSVTAKFTGQELDEEIDLYYYGARYYDPFIGRFTTADTIVPDGTNSQAFNRYMYVIGNPITYQDPTGHAYFGPGETDEEIIEEHQEYSQGRDSGLDWNTYDYWEIIHDEESFVVDSYIYGPLIPANPYLLDWTSGDYGNYKISSVLLNFDDGENCMIKDCLYDISTTETGKKLLRPLINSSLSHELVSYESKDKRIGGVSRYSSIVTTDKDPMPCFYERCSAKIHFVTTPVEVDTLDGQGFYLQSMDSQLVHELTHQYRFAKGLYSNNRIREEVIAIRKENRYNEEMGYPLRGFKIDIKKDGSTKIDY